MSNIVNGQQSVMRKLSQKFEWNFPSVTEVLFKNSYDADFIRAMSTIEAEQERCLEIGQIPNGFMTGTDPE